MKNQWIKELKNAEKHIKKGEIKEAKKTIDKVTKAIEEYFDLINLKDCPFFCETCFKANLCPYKDSKWWDCL